MNMEVKEWLLDGPIWIKYAVERQLLNMTVSPHEAITSSPIEMIVRFLMEGDEGIESILKGTASYKKEGFWYLYFLSEVGITSQDLSLDEELKKILRLEDDNSRFILSKEMKPDYFCISSILLTSIARLSSDCKEALKPHIELLFSVQRLDGGWHCAKSRAIGKKLESSESCPMDNLNILMLLSVYDIYRADVRLNGAIDLLLNHWGRRGEQWRPYGFGIGTQFHKLRYPESKYGILRVLDILSNYPYAIRSPQFKDMYITIIEKQVNGKYYAESIVKSFSDFDFGQKEEPSRWITFLIERIGYRISEVEKNIHTDLFT